MALPHTLLIPEGSRGGAKTAKAARVGREFLYTKEGQNAVRSSRVVFVGSLPLGKRQNAVHFPFQFTMCKCMD